MPQARLNAFPPDFSYDGRFPIDLNAPPPPAPQVAPPALTEVHDARPLQAAATSVADFFETHGFALLQHPTRVADWDTDVATIYDGEIEALIRDQVLPGRKLNIAPGASLVRRGRGTANDYAGGVHQDCGLTPDDYQQMVGAFASPQAAQGWRYMYDGDNVEGFLALDFWRPTHMREPLRHMPLAVCDPASVDPADIVPTQIYGVAPEGRPAHQMCLRRNPQQRWYYYPDMTVDEVLVFKIFESRKADAAPVLRSCFHTAFADPATPADAEPRQSCEYRIGMWLLKA